MRYKIQIINLTLPLGVQNYILDIKVVVLLSVFLLFGSAVHGQLGFCQGNSGDIIFSENFGTGHGIGPALAAGTTTYTFVNTAGPQDGEYTIANSTDFYGWNLPFDHTVSDSNGKALIVNASFTTGEFYSIAVNGLCENTTYEFSSWLINILPSYGCDGNGIPVNVQFQIWDDTNTSLLASGDTGNIYGTSSPTWQPYGLVFQTLANQTSVILKMINNGAGGCGNDLAIDDIVFKSCGDEILTQDQNSSQAVTRCSTQGPFSETLTAVPDYSVYSAHYYQWQTSSDNSLWSNVVGENNASIVVSNIMSTTYYRVKVAEYAANLNNSDCITFSEVYGIVVYEAPPEPELACWESAVFDENSCDWLISGTPPEMPVNLECWEYATFNNVSCTWEITGSAPEMPVNLECWQTAVFNTENCEWDLLGEPTVELLESFVVLCEGSTLSLQANGSLANATYLWDTGEFQPVKPVEAPGVYEVLITNGCETIQQTFYVEEAVIPVVESVHSEGHTFIIKLLSEGDFEYSLDGVWYQTSSEFTVSEGALYTVYVRSVGCDAIATTSYLYFKIPKFITPNGDLNNDVFTIRGWDNFSTSEVSIYNRYGRLLYHVKNAPPFWDGTFNNEPLPNSDYWYRIVVDGKVYTGHFTLKH